MRYNSRPTQWGNQKSLTLASAGENAEREKVSRTAGRNAHLHIHFRKQFGKMSSSFEDEHLQPRIPFAIREMEANVHKR